MSDVRILPDSIEVTRAAAELISALGNDAIEIRGRFSLVLSGGSTPRALYELLAREPYVSQIHWEAVNIFWGDERCVYPDHVDSNYRMAREALLGRVSVRPENIYRMKGETNPQQAARDYEGILREYFGNLETRFDVVLLGMGDDGHTASLFPLSPALDEEERLVVANFVSDKQAWRITLTARAINAATTVIFLVSGGNKAERLKEVIKGSYQPHELPSQLIKPHSGNLIWLVDKAAAAEL